MEKQKLFSISCGIAGAMVACSCAQQPEAEWKQSPNVIYILADDLGIGDISPYGQNLIKTPNLQRMSDEGMRFTQCYSGTSVSKRERDPTFFLFATQESLIYRTFATLKKVFAEACR